MLSTINSFKGFLVLLSVLFSEEGRGLEKKETKFCCRAGNRIISPTCGRWRQTVSGLITRMINSPAKHGWLIFT